MSRPANDDEPDRLEISDSEVAAYVRRELDDVGRRRVEGYLACNPDLAAKTMSELHRSGSQSTGGSRRKRIGVALLTCGLIVSVASVMAGSGLSTRWREADGDAAPSYIEDAAESQQATLVRSAMASQPEETRLDAAEIQKKMGIRLPVLPAGWTVLDVQVYPSDDGPAVNLWLKAPDAMRFSLFAVRADAVADHRLQLASDGVRSAAFWEVGRSAFVLLGDGERRALLRQAQVLSGNTSI